MKVNIPFELATKRAWESWFRRSSTPNLYELRPRTYVAASWSWYSSSRRPCGRPLDPPKLNRPLIEVNGLFGSLSEKSNLDRTYANRASFRKRGVNVRV